LELPWVAAAAIICLIVGGLGVWKLKPTPPTESRHITRFSLVLPGNQNFQAGRYIAMSPDGTKLVYAAAGGLYSRQIDDFTVKPIPGAEGNEVQNPFF
jgi:hypothetical protein